ncbi:TetR/AcrR family transcriptional regulator [uncultured Phenylobacterium sp.]|uniref:TetR/AcrR family transcriptional regulator n=1 Tax=uncultured Phenylobacterium sp. TaxID=349273 RepID=UPI0025DEBB8B|nr:TetR family transcriptional regulator [uncultured Phenylobacterium sp.]
MPRPRRISDEEILAGTLAVIMYTGPAEFTLAAVAAEVGLAPSTLLQRFGDKRRLILAALTQDNSEFAAAIAQAPTTRERGSVIGLFLLLTPDIHDPDTLGTGLLWMREDFRDPGLNALARERWQLLREAVAERLPPVRIAPDIAARLLEAQWQGAFNQWGFFREGRLPDFVAASLDAWFDLAEA